MPRPRDEAWAYSSESCGAKGRMWNANFPPWVGAQPGARTHRFGDTNAFLLLLCRGGESHFLYPSLRTNSQVLQMSGYHPVPTTFHPPSPTLHLYTCCSGVGSHCSSHLGNTPHPVLNPLRKRKDFGLFLLVLACLWRSCLPPGTMWTHPFAYSIQSFYSQIIHPAVLFPPYTTVSAICVSTPPFLNLYAGHRLWYMDRPASIELEYAELNKRFS